MLKIRVLARACVQADSTPCDEMRRGAYFWFPRISFFFLVMCCVVLYCSVLYHLAFSYHVICCWFVRCAVQVRFWSINGVESCLLIVVNGLAWCNVGSVFVFFLKALFLLVLLFFSSIIQRFRRCSTMSPTDRSLNPLVLYYTGQGPMFGNLQKGQDITLPDGTIVRPSQVSHVQSGAA